MPSPTPDFDQIPEADIPRAMLLELAAEFGIRDDVAAVLKAKEAAGGYGLRTMTLARVLRIARAGRGRKQVSDACTLAPSIISAQERGDSKNLRMDTALKMSRGYRVPFILLICAAMRQYGFLPAPGAKPTPRNRTRVRKSG
ncbi:MAG: hypothetical protein JXR75_00905 [Rhodobacteraceae bacterium]|nr:hypothetical protein [Paracoccaceae bacterium]